MTRYEIEVLPWAIDDAREAYLYLLERDERLADEFQRRVSEALRALAETAHHYQAREDSIRRCPLKKFPHGIMYELQGGRVVVYAPGRVSPTPALVDAPTRVAARARSQLGDSTSPSTPGNTGGRTLRAAAVLASLAHVYPFGGPHVLHGRARRTLSVHVHRSRRATIERAGPRSIRL